MIPTAAAPRPTADGDLLLTFVATADAAYFNTPAGVEIRAVVPAEPGTKLMVADYVQSVAGSVTGLATLGAADPWGAILAAFKPAGAAGTVPPNISSLSPSSASAGISVVIGGTNFGSLQGTSTVTFNGTAATPTNWSDTSITVPVPTGATTGNVAVTVGGIASNGVNFTVVPPTPPSITASISPAPNVNGWNNSAVTVSFTCVAGTYSIQTCTSPVNVTAEGANQVVTGTVTDTFGNSATATATVSLDSTSPTLSVSSPPDGAIVTNAKLNISGLAADSLSGLNDVSCTGAEATIANGSFSCRVTLAVGANAIQVQGIDNAGNTATASLNVTYSLDPPPTALFVTPDHLAMAMSEARKVALVDDLARAIPASNWTISDPTVAQVAADGTITPLAAGNVTITGFYQSLSATSQLTVYGSPTLPGGTLRWGLQPLPGDTLINVYPGQASAADDPDMYFMESSGPNIVVRALTSDGRQVWAHTILPTSGSGGARMRYMQHAPSLQRTNLGQSQEPGVRPHRWGKKIAAFIKRMEAKHQKLLTAQASKESQGASLVPASFRASPKPRPSEERHKPALRTVQSGTTVDSTVLASATTDAGNEVLNTFEVPSSGGCSSRVDNIIVLDTDGNELWRHSIACGEMGFALHPNGIVYILQADYNANGAVTLFAMDETTGATKFSIQLPWSYGAQLQPFVGLPSVFPDGNLYLPVETAADANAPDVLQLLKVTPDGTPSWQFIANATQCFGPVIEPHEAIPDGQGGALVTWDYFGSYTLCNGNQTAVKVARTSGTQVTGTYQLPLARGMLTSYFSDNDGDAVLGQNHFFVTDSRSSVAGLQLSTSTIDVNWQGAACTTSPCPEISLAGVAPGDKVIVNQTGNSDGSSTLFSLTPGTGTCAPSTFCVTSAPPVPNATLVAFDFTSAYLPWVYDTLVFTSDNYFCLCLLVPADPAAPPIRVGGSVTPPDTTAVPDPDLLPPWPEEAMKHSRKALPISIKLNFTGGKTPGDNLVFQLETDRGVIECSEGLGLQDCTSTSGYWLRNLEGFAKVHDDASNWAVVVSHGPIHSSGFYRDIDNNLRPFECTYPSELDDGPLHSYLQQPTGQKSIFYIDGPGPYSGAFGRDACQPGGNPIDSLTWWTNFKVTFTSRVSNYSQSVPYYVKTVIAPGRQRDFTNSSANEGLLPPP